MLKNYFTIALRTLSRYKSYTLINVLGLAAGITCCLLIFLVVRFELSFDRFHSKADRIYRVGTRFLRDGENSFFGTPYPTAKALKADYPEVENATTIDFAQSGIIRVGDDIYRENGLAYVEPSFFALFDYPWVAGNPEKALGQPNSVVLAETMARKYFGSADGSVLGKTIRLDNQTDLQVTGVVQDFPTNTDLPFSILISFATLRNPNGPDLESWTNVSWSTTNFVLLKSGQTADHLEKSMKDFIQKYSGEEMTTRRTYHFQPLKEIHSDPEFGNYNRRVFSKSTVMALTAIGIFLLLTACINFINLATAQAIKRAKEVGVRKVLGAVRGQLVNQFLGETFVLTLTAALLSLLLATFLLPPLERFLGTSINFRPSHDWAVFLFLVGVIPVISVLSGLYPAWILSGYKPVLAIKSKMGSYSTGGVLLRRGLIVFQFVVSQVLIIGLIVVSQQLNYFLNKPLGFNKEAVISANVPRTATPPQLQTLRNRLASTPGVANASLALFTPSNEGGWFAPFNYEGSGTDQDMVVEMRPIDHTYVQTFGLELLAGHDLTERGDSSEILVNEAFIHQMNLQKPVDALNRKVSQFGRTLTIVGVVKNFHSQSLRQEIGSVMMSKRPGVRIAGIKLASQQPKQTIAQIEKIWKTTFPEELFEYRFLDEQIANFYRNEERTTGLFRIFAGVAIFIGCLGLYGLVSFMAETRTKEIGIRKVLGASASNIMLLFSKEFTRLIMLAFLIAAPIAWYLMNNWLRDFSYKIAIGPGVFLLAVGLTLSIAALTVSYRTIRAALANPVKSLRAE